MKMNEEMKTIGKTCLVLILYGLLVFTNLIALPFYLFHIEIASIPRWIRLIYSLSWEVALLGLIYYLFKEEFKRDFEDLKKNHQTYFKKYFKYWFLLLGLMMVSNLIIQLYTSSEIAGNEEAIRELMKTSPVYTFVSAVLVAPFLEESVFRFSLRKLLKNKYLFIALSGLIFGGLHVIGTVEVVTDYLYIIPYSIPGFIFAYLYVETDNIFTSTAMHLMHNGILLSLQILLYFFL